MVLLSVLLTTLLRLTLDPFLGRKAALIMYFPALVFSAWVGGWTGGLAALTLSALAATYCFLSPHHSLTIASQSDQLTLLIFTVVGLSVSAISSAQRRTKQQAEESAVALREREVILRQNEATLIESEAILRESETRKSAVLEVALDCIITADGRGCILEFNPAAERTFGYSRAEVLGKPVAETIIPHSLRTAHYRGLENYLTKGEGPILRKRIEVIGMRKDGSEFPVEIAIVPTQGIGVEFTAYLRDITDRRQQEEERAELLEEVQASTLKQRTFLRDVLASVTEGRLVLCDTASDLPAVPPSFGPSIPLSMASGLRDLRRSIQGACQAAGFSEERCYDLVTAASEAGMNAAVHVGSGEGQVFVDEGRSVVQVRIEDRGPGISLENLPHATLMKGYSSAGTLGHGMKMMLQTADHVFLLTSSVGTTVVVEQGRVAPPSAW
ncbi:MAG: PAS domain S-box protein [Janthinobacterium lividum]